MRIDEPGILFRINEMYREGMSAQALYEATRGEWKVGPRRAQASYAFAVYEGIVREAYRIERWFPAGTTQYRTHTFNGDPDQWEFEGVLAEEGIRARYVGQSVSAYFPRISFGVSTAHKASAITNASS